MRRFVAFAAVAATLVVLSSTAEANNANTLDSGEVTAALLKLRDLPFRHWQYAASKSLPSTGRCNGQTAFGRAESTGMMSKGSVHFQGDAEVGPSVDEDIYVFPSKAKASAFVSRSKS